MSIVQVQNVKIGEGQPKIIVPIVAKTESEILEKAKEISQVDCDLVEWRIDHFDKVEEKGAVSALSSRVRDALGKPLLITFRSEREGGVLAMSDDDYVALLKEIMNNGQLDLMDVELFMPEEAVKELVALANTKQIKVVMCNHDFDKTSPKDEIVSRLIKMEELGGDICKIAVTPQSREDVVTLLDATVEADAKVQAPLITMSMGTLGVISRVAGATFGSAATFGAVGEVSAPGQISAEDLRFVMNTLG